ncbi:FAD/NAD(P)-binding protein [Streptomyces sp. Tu6071]|uniref:FAD/NAD(P)-binding protein n=1 Tax=Streptomyces sp. Tu6071 TaxID=355249 RepID=UPI0002F45E92|nr:FAD/NAD(P)-binding protein [Streptomyces sp. Tu6071]
MTSAPAEPPVVVVVGAGPRATGLLERIAANTAAGYGGPDPAFVLHLVDPYPPGPGRIWRREQSPLLWMNSMAEDTTLFTDETVEIEGPVVPGPALHDWAGIGGRTFPDRRTQGAYLRWAYEQARAALPPGIVVHEHRTRAVRLEGPREGRQSVWLADRESPLTADLVVLTLGHQEAELAPEERQFAAHAAREGLTYLPPDYTADTDLRGLRAGEPVLVRGLGLAFVDLMVLLTEGRGGRWTPEGRYVPSGKEPILYVGSRRGVPYHVKLGYRLEGELPKLPRFFGPEQTTGLLAREGPLDFRADVWPLVAKELGWAHYHRLLTTRPHAFAVDRDAFESGYAAADPYDGSLDAFVRTAVPAATDRLDLDALDRPLAGWTARTQEEAQARLLAHIDADLDRRHDPAHSEDLAVFMALLSVYGQLMRLGDLGTWWHGFFSFLASGPPGPRLRALRGLAEAGLVRFLGADMTVRAVDGAFEARSASLPEHAVRARALVEARLPQPEAGRVRDPLLRGLFAAGALATEDGLLAVTPGDGRVRWNDGSTHPRLFALGPHTDARGAGAFTRPRTNSPAFRQNDATARALLAGVSGTGVPGTGVSGAAVASEGGGAGAVGVSGAGPAAVAVAAGVAPAFVPVPVVGAASGEGAGGVSVGLSAGPSGVQSAGPSGVLSAGPSGVLSAGPSPETSADSSAGPEPGRDPDAGSVSVPTTTSAVKESVR